MIRGSFVYHVFLIIAFSATGNMQSVNAQNQETDTVNIIEKLVEKIDTIVRIVIPDSTLQRWEEQPIDSMFLRNNNPRFMRELYNLMVRSPVDTIKTPTTNTGLAAVDGKIIRKITFGHVDIFTPSVTDTNYRASSWFERTVNGSHKDTRKYILKRYLLLKPGDILDVFLAADNERVLRDLPFIMDARFIAKPVKGNPDSVDLVLYTQDKFPLGFEAAIEHSSIAVVGFAHQNFLGYGHQLSATSYWDAGNNPFFGYRLSYGSSNVAGTFTSGRVEYIHRWNQETYHINISRDFKTSRIRNAGGFSFERTDLIRSVHQLDTIFENSKIKFAITDIWAARTFFPLRNYSYYMRSGLFLAGRVNIYTDIQEPEIEDVYMHPFKDRTLVLVSGGFSRQGFRNDNLIYTFGRTEDVPYGYLFDFTTGTEWSTSKTQTVFLYSEHHMVHSSAIRLIYSDRYDLAPLSIKGIPNREL